MIACIKKGRLEYIHIYRKCYRKARWKRAIGRCIKRTMKNFPGYDGLILYL